MDDDPTKAHQLLDRLAELHECCDPDEAWRIALQPHDHPDGTTHFTHVRATGRLWTGDEAEWTVASHLTPEAAELLVSMRNNLPDLIRWARVGLEAVAAGSGSGGRHQDRPAPKAPTTAASDAARCPSNRWGCLADDPWNPEVDRTVGDAWERAVRNARAVVEALPARPAKPSDASDTG